MWDALFFFFLFFFLPFDSVDVDVVDMGAALGLWVFESF